MNPYEDIAQEIYNLNETFQTFILILCELHGKPLEYLNSDGSYKFMEARK